MSEIAELPPLPRNLHSLPANVLASHESALVEHAKMGNSEAFAGLVRLATPSVEAAVGRFRQLSRPEQEDVVQKTYFNLFKGLHTYRHQSRFTSFAHTVAVNTAISHLRSKNKRILVPLELAMKGALPRDAYHPSAEAIIDVLERDDQHRQLWAAIESLPPTHRDMLRAHIGDDLSYEELAKRFGIKMQAVKSRLFRAREALFAKMDKTGVRLRPGRPRQSRR